MRTHRGGPRGEIAAHAGPPVALRFIAAVELAFRRIARHPGAGSPRYAHELDPLNLRVWRLQRCPYLVFYIDHPDHIDVWRVLQAQRDLPTSLQPDDMA